MTEDRRQPVPGQKPQAVSPPQPGRIRQAHLSERRKAVGWFAMVCLLGLSLPHAKAQPLRLFETTRTHNTPGLRCWGIRGGMASKIVVFARPAAGSSALGYTVSMVAATGQPKNGYLPVLTSVGVSGWVREAEVDRDRWMGQTCVVRREANGYLTFIYGHDATP